MDHERTGALVRWLLDRVNRALDLSDLLFVAVGGCLGAAMMTVWTWWDPPQGWGGSLTVIVCIFWMAMSAVFAWLALDTKRSR